MLVAVAGSEWHLSQVGKKSLPIKRHPLDFSEILFTGTLKQQQRFILFHFIYSVIFKHVKSCRSLVAVECSDPPCLWFNV